MREDFIANAGERDGWLELQGYSTVERLAGLEDCDFYRLRSLANGSGVIAKTPRAAHPDRKAAETLREEYETFRRIGGRGALKALELAAAGDRPVILFQDMGGNLMEAYLPKRGRSLPLADFVRVAVSAADSLMRLHREELVPLAVSPSRLWVNPESGEAKFADLRYRSREPESAAEVADYPLSLQPYLSPEQTGRTGNRPDYRSGFYALGVTFYEWFSGVLPFERGEEPDLFYRHLAIAPRPLGLENPDIPDTLSRIVGKCLEKSPESRYMSAYGLKLDLEKFLSAFESTGEGPLFEPGERDVPRRFRFPRALYGRDEERRRLTEALERANSGTVETIEIHGGVGTGKTFFVEETLKETELGERGFAAGRFDSAKDSAPYAAWMQMIESLTDRLLTAGKLEIEVWRLRMLNALEGHGRLLVERVPRLESLIGPQPEAPVLPPAEAKRRFHRVLIRFFQAFPSRDRPLVLFLDDLQRADEASLSFLYDFLDDGDTKHALLILAYRDDAPAADHKIGHLRDRLSGKGMVWTRLRLMPLGERDTEPLLQETLRGEPERNRELAALLRRITVGNPLFLKQLLKDLLESRALSFDEDAGRWTWDENAVSKPNMGEDAAAYLSEKLAHMAGSIVHALSRAAFLGSSFEAERLKRLVEPEEERLSEALEAAVREGLIQTDNRGGHRFRHDRIQQAAYERVPEEDRIELHYLIGMERWDLRERETDDFDDFEAAYHLNLAAAKFADEDGRKRLARVNMSAGLKAKRSTAYETALGYYTRATDLLADDSWDGDYETLFRAHRERAELEYLCSQLEAARERLVFLLGKARTKLDQAVVFNLMMQLEVGAGNRDEVIGLAKKTLALLDVAMPVRFGRVRLLRQMAKVALKLRGHSAETIANLPAMTDETGKIALKTLDAGTSALFLEDKNGWLAYTLTMVELTLERGLAPESCSGFIGYALFQYYAFQRMDEAYRWGMAALELAKPYPLLRMRTLSAFQLCIDSWSKHDPGLLSLFSESAGKAGLESGDLWQGYQSVLIDCAIRFYLGHPISGIYELLVAHGGKFRRHSRHLLWKQATLLAAMLAKLSGNRPPGDPYPIEEVDQEDFAAFVSDDSSGALESFSSTSKVIYAYLFERYEEANEVLEKTKAVSAMASDKTQSEDTVRALYEALVWLRLYETVPAGKRRERWAEIRKRRNTLRKHAKLCPVNYAHKRLLIEAEMAGAKGKSRKAEELYEKSIEAAGNNGHIHDLAIAAECCGKFMLRLGKPHRAKAYLTEAHEAYRRWGAHPKAEQMVRRHGDLLKPAQDAAFGRVDYLSVVESVRAISGEMEMNRLLDRLMRILLRNSGAEFGALLSEYDGRWVAEAYGTLEKLSIEPVPIDSIAPDRYDEMPAAVVGYAVRTRETILLHDAAGEGMFAQTPYIRDKGVKSVLCLPIWHQNQMISLIYLENKLSSNIFTPQRLEWVKLLASQAAISLANAKLYAGIQELRSNLENQVEERTRSLERAMLETSVALAEASVYEERNRIAQEIHDIVGHTLTSTVIQIEAGKRLLLKDSHEAANRLQEAQQLVRHSLNEIRGSVHMLKQDKYSDLGALIKQLIEDTVRNAGVSIRAEIDPLPELPPGHRKTIYHALQEGLTNGIRHGEGQSFRFALRVIRQNVLFRLEDDGRGAEQVVPGFGLKAMRDRVEQLGGRMAVESRRGGGFRLTFELPYPAKRSADTDE